MNNDNETNHHYEEMNDKQFDSITQRMDRMESKLDKITDALIQLARTEERMIKLEEERKSIRKQVDIQHEQIIEIQKNVLNNSRLGDTFYKVIWIVIAALCTAWIASMFVGPGKLELGAPKIGVSKLVDPSSPPFSADASAAR